MKNKIFLMDVVEFLNTIKDKSVDLIIADPPYNIGIDEWDKFDSQDQYWMFMKKWISLCIQKMKIGASIYIFNNQFNSAITLNLLKNKLTFNNWITWYKKDGFHPSKNKFVNNQETCLFMSNGNPKIFNFDNVRIPYLSKQRLSNSLGIKTKQGKYWKPNPKGKLCTDVWEFSSERHSKKINGKTKKLSHPTIKPQAMIERILNASANKNSIVLDLFSGSGQTIIACNKLGINCSGCENNKLFYKNILRNIKNGKIN